LREIPEAGFDDEELPRSLDGDNPASIVHDGSATLSSDTKDFAGKTPFMTDPLM
jgi:hypothetical protein